MVVNNNEQTPDIAGKAGEHPALDPFPILVAPTTSGKGKNTIRMELIALACWRLEDVRFAFGSSFLLPATRREFDELAELIAKHPKAPLSVFGHADPVSSDASNKPLSGHRAEAVYAVLIRDASRWENLYNAAGTAEGWGIKSIQEMLRALGHDPGSIDGVLGPKTKAMVEAFQTGTKSLRVDGNPGPKTRAKLFAAYMDFLCPLQLARTDFLGQGLDAGGKGDFQGCSEFNPVMVFSQSQAQSMPKQERDSQNAANRRVMILLFRPGTPPSAKWPCPRASEGIDGCRARFWSDGEKRRNPQAAQRTFPETKDTFACRFYHRLVAGSPCEGVAACVPILLQLQWPAELLEMLPSDFQLTLSGPAVPAQRRTRSDAIDDGDYFAFEFAWENCRLPVQLEASGKGGNVVLWNRQCVGDLKRDINWFERLAPILSSPADSEAETEDTNASRIPDDLGGEYYATYLQELL